MKSRAKVNKEQNRWMNLLLNQDSLSIRPDMAEYIDDLLKDTRKSIIQCVEIPQLTLRARHTLDRIAYEYKIHGYLSNRIKNIPIPLITSDMTRKTELDKERVKYFKNLRRKLPMNPNKSVVDLGNEQQDVNQIAPSTDNKDAKSPDIKNLKIESTNTVLKFGCIEDDFTNTKDTLKSYSNTRAKIVGVMKNLKTQNAKTSLLAKDDLSNRIENSHYRVDDVNSHENTRFQDAITNNHTLVSQYSNLKDSVSRNKRKFLRNLGKLKKSEKDTNRWESERVKY